MPTQTHTNHSHRGIDPATLENIEKLLDKSEKLRAKGNDSGVTKEEGAAFRAKAEQLKREAEEMRRNAKTGSEKQYAEYVTEGLKLIHRQSSSMWELGDLVSNVETAYGEDTLERYAKDIGVPYSTVKHCRATFIAWPEKAGRPAFWTAMLLNKLESRFDIIKKKPGLTQDQARKIAKEHRQVRRASSKPNKKRKPPRVAKVCAAIDELLNKGSSEATLLQAVALKDTDAGQRKSLLRSLSALAQRVQSEVARINAAGKLN